MALEFIGSNAIVLAPSQLNPAVFTQAWMIDNLQVAANEFLDQGTLQLPMLFTAATTRFNLLVLQDRIQMAPSLQRGDNQEDEGALISRVIGRAIRLFQDLPYTALGLNYSWAVYWNEHPNNETSRRLFFAAGNSLFRIFDTPDACFGAYVSKNTMGFRLRVDAKPITEQGEQPTTKRLLFSFNFHQDLSGDNRVHQIDQLLGLWNEARAEASRILEQVNRECAL